MFEKLAKFNKTYLALAIFAVIIAIFYGNTLANGFVQDDHLIVEQNEYVRSLRYLPQIATGKIWDDSVQMAGVYYRPMQHLSYMVSYQFSSQASFFHLINLIYFWGIAAVLFLVTKLLTKSWLAGFIAAVIFIIHPINTEVVNSIAAVPELAMTLFALLATLFYIRHRTILQEHKVFSKNFLFVLLFYTAALFSKEPALLLPTIFIFLDLFYFRVKPQEFLRKNELARYGVLAGSALLYLILRTSFLGWGSVSQSPFGAFSFTERIYAFFTLFAQYIEKLVYPLPLLFMYTFEKGSDFASFEFLSSFFLIVLFFVTLFVLLIKKKARYAFPFAWFFVFLSLVLLFPNGLGESVFAERYMFLSTVGFAVLGGLVSSSLWRSRKEARIALVIVGIVLTSISFVIVYNHNKAWANDETLYLDILAKNPRADTMRFNYAVYLRNQKGDFEAAKEHFVYIAENNPTWVTADMVYLHLGDYYRSLGDWENAFVYYEQSIAASEDAGDWKGQFAASRISQYYSEQEEHLRALPYFCKAANFTPEDQRPAERFDVAIATIMSRYETDMQSLYRDLISQDSFSKSEREGMIYRKRECEEGFCSFIFSLRTEPSEVILPFIIIAATESGRVVEIIGSGLSPQGTEAVLQTDIRYKNEELTFLFPTCDGIYYEAVASN